ncbi:MULTISPECIES: amidase family protein [unclassified Amycolatopsis]|uniref:amidase family protein n=1 Tax=unclassified Amycolatopsis TaxID=2618356 RepID=UPI001C6A139C|nr:amidase family protein [Amycolatopsis sp. DSM 110486]QYN19042.1 FCD domain-containing protein [Amycolatopsis sp. DSM 110486]
MTSVADEVYGRIREAILDGTYPPGTRLSLRTLADELGVSTMPARESLKRLGVEGLVVFGRRSVTVANLSTDEVRQIFEIRQRLEGLATQWAAEQATEEDLRDLRAILDEMADANLDPVVWRGLNRRFHDRLYSCSDSPHLLDLIRNIWDRVTPSMAIYATAVEDFAEAHRQHQQILHLFATKDLPALLAMTAEHLEHTATTVVTALASAAGTALEGDQAMTYDELTIESFHAALAAGATTSADLTRWYLGRIEAIDQSQDGPRLGSYVTLNPHAVAEAAALDERYAATGELTGPLHGVPVVLKDQAETAGIATSFGSGLFADYVPEQDATVVARLRAAGAVILGKSTMCDFAAGWFSFSSRSGFTKNPYDFDREPGGSSAGTAAAVAANLALVGIGEDTGGSIRLPSSFTNLFGLRVTTGLIPRTGFSPLVHFQDTPGPLARTVPDLAATLDVVVGYDPADAYTSLAASSPEVGRYQEALDDVTPGTLAGFSIGVLADAFGTQPESGETNEVVATAVKHLAGLGVRVVHDVELGDGELDLAGWVAATSLYTTVSKHDIDAFLAARPHAPVHSVEQVHASGVFHELTDLLPDIAAGPADPADDPAYYARRLRQEELRRRLVDLMARSGTDFLVYPTVQVPPPTREALAAKRWTALDFPTNTVLASQSSLPAMSIPCGFTPAGLPVGLEVLGKPLAERALLRFARAWELATSPRRPSPLLTSAPA